MHDIDSPTDAAELKRIEAGEAKARKFLSSTRSSAAWIRYGRNEKIGNTAKRGDSLAIIHRPTDAVAPDKVYPHTAVLHVQKEPNCTRVFYEETPGAERKRLSWSEFRKLAKTVRLPTNLSKSTTRQVSDKVSDDLNHYWNQVRRKQVLR